MSERERTTVARTSSVAKSSSDTLVETSDVPGPLTVMQQQAGNAATSRALHIGRSGLDRISSAFGADISSVSYDLRPFEQRPSRRDVVEDAADVRPGAVERAFDDRSPGHPLDPRLREGLGGDIPEVVVHADDIAAALAADLGADAFTRGAHVYFAAGRYEPMSPVGEGLLRHELAHVVQQASGDLSGFAGRLVPPDHPSETQAQSHPPLVRGSRVPTGRDSGIHRQVIQRQPTGLGDVATKAGPASGSLPGDGVEKIYDALVSKWEALSEAKTRDLGGDKIKGECAAFILMIGERPPSYAFAVKRMVHDQLGVGSDRPGLDRFLSGYVVAIDRFATDLGRKVVSDLRASSSDPLQTWQWAQQGFAEFLTDGGRGSTFNDKVEDAVLGDYEKRAAKDLRRRPAELQEMADSQVARIIDEFATNIYIGVTQAGAEFHLPMPVGKHYNKSAGAAAMSLFATEVGEMFLKHGGKLVKLGLHALPFATLAFELLSIWNEANEKEEEIRKENKRGELEGRAKHELFLAYDKAVAGIRSRQDVLSVLVVADALKQGINPKAAGKHRLQDLVIENLGFDSDVRDPAKVLEKASWKLREASEELQQQLTE